MEMYTFNFLTLRSQEVKSILEIESLKVEPTEVCWTFPQSASAFRISSLLVSIIIITTFITTTTTFTTTTTINIFHQGGRRFQKQRKLLRSLLSCSTVRPTHPQHWLTASGFFRFLPLSVCVNISGQKALRRWWKPKGSFIHGTQVEDTFQTHPIPFFHTIFFSFSHIIAKLSLQLPLAE